MNLSDHVVRTSRAIFHVTCDSAGRSRIEKRRGSRTSNGEITRTRTRKVRKGRELDRMPDVARFTKEA